MVSYHAAWSLYAATNVQRTMANNPWVRSLEKTPANPEHASLGLAANRVSIMPGRFPFIWKETFRIWITNYL